jgi:hypothetical protein
VFFSLYHSKNALTKVTLKDLKITRYRGGVSFVCDTPKCTPPNDSLPTVSSENVIDHVVFDQIGDAYWASSLEHAGKGAILLKHTGGTKILNSTFTHIDNVPERGGLIHSIYMTSGVIGSIVSGNTFVGGTGAIIKVTDRSNGNTFTNNSFADNVFGIRDRFLGSRPEDEPEPTQCASWGNVISGNRFSDVSVHAIAYGYVRGVTCRFAEPANKIRMICDGVPKLGPTTQVCVNP